jgi:hypothetical protein
MSRLLLAGAVLFGVGTLAPRTAEAQGTRRISCESRDDRFSYCKASTRGYARLLRNVSDTRCVLNRTWGFDQDGVWVDRGCRGEFEVGGGSGSWEQFENGRRVVCESRDREYQLCRVNTRGDVRMVRQLSQRPCTARRTWGFQRDGIWVTEGCRAEFEVGYADVSWEGDDRRLTCESNDRKYTRCRVWTYGTVRLVRQLSDTRCQQGRTWGYDRDGIWVDDGCRALFSVGVNQGGGGWGEWGGGGGTGGGGSGSWQSNRARAERECESAARARGYRNVRATGASGRPGGDVWVDERAERNSADYTLGCFYDVSRGRAEIQTEKQDGGFGGSGGSGSLLGTARDECARVARTMGYTGLRVTSTDQQRNDVWVRGEARSNGRDWRLACRYDTGARRATITEQSQVGR